MPIRIGSELTHARSVLANAHRTGKQPEIDSARRDFAAAKLAQVIEDVVASAPPFTRDQKDRLTALLRSPRG